MSSPSPSDEGGASSVDEGVAIGVDREALLDRLLRCPLEGGAASDGVGVVSELANRECGCGGVAYAGEADESRPRLRRVPSPGDEKVLPIGLENESSGEEGPVMFHVKLVPNKISPWSGCFEIFMQLNNIPSLKFCTTREMRKTKSMNRMPQRNTFYFYKTKQHKIQNFLFLSKISLSNEQKFLKKKE